MWPELLKENNVGIELEGEDGPVEKTTAAQLDKVEQKLKLKLPASYREFCQELGPGVMADLITIMAPCPDNEAVDLSRRVKDGRMGLKDAKEETDTLDKFDPEKMVSFASTLSGDEFYWKIDEPTKQDEYAIYGLTHEMPPRMLRVADSFHDFIMEAALGERLLETGFYGRFNESHPRLFFPAPKLRKGKKK